MYSNEEIPTLLKNKKEIIGIEIGVERGGSAFNLLENSDVKILYLIEPYLPYTDLEGEHVCDEHCQKNNKKICLDTLKNFTNFQLIEKSSDEAFNFFEDESLDYIFIDGLHTYEQCYKDMENYYPKLKKGGLFYGHDFTYVSKVREAVENFSKKVNKEIENCKNDVWYWIK